MTRKRRHDPVDTFGVVVAAMFAAMLVLCAVGLALTISHGPP